MLVADAGFGVWSCVRPAASRPSRSPRTGAATSCASAAGCALALPHLARRTVEAGLTGLEWAVGVPGPVGGALRMNAGGHGSDVAASRCWGTAGWTSPGRVGETGTPPRSASATAARRSFGAVHPGLECSFYRTASTQSTLFCIFSMIFCPVFFDDFRPDGAGDSGQNRRNWARIHTKPGCTAKARRGKDAKQEDGR